MNASLLFGLVLGVVSTLTLGFLAAYLVFPDLILRERRSQYGLEETVRWLTGLATDAGWVVQGVVELDQSVKKNGGGEILPVRLVNLCQAHHAAAVLKVDSVRKVSVLMPCTISVYEKSDGNVYVGSLNAGLLARFFGGVVARVMGKDVAADQRALINAVTVR